MLAKCVLQEIKTDSVTTYIEKFIENYLMEETLEAMDEDEFENSLDYSESEDIFSIEDLAPEESGSDEIDWESHDK